MAGEDSYCYFDDNGYGVLRIYKLNNGEKIYLNINAGSVDYDEGILIIGSIIFLSIADGTQEIRFLISPNNKLYKPLKNEILLLNHKK